LHFSHRQIVVYAAAVTGVGDAEVVEEGLHADAEVS
jgi:hypothetical protein